MKTPGRYAADWIVDDPRRSTLTPKTDRAFYTAVTNAALVLTAVGVVVLVLGLLT